MEILSVPSLLPEMLAADPNVMLDALLNHQRLKNDAALSRALDVSPSSISKMRSGRQSVTAVFLLRVHETFGIGFRELRNLICPHGMTTQAPRASLGMHSPA